jgi:probable O-glycosylation ligase (exosortase A-associated)
MTITTICVVDSFDRLRIFLLVIAACLGVFVLKDLPFMIATGGSFRLYGPPQSMIADNNDFGLALNMTLPLFFFLGKTEPNGRIRMFMYFMALITVPAIFFTYSRGALLGLGVVAMILFLRVKKRILLLPVLGLATLAAVVLAPASWQDRMSFFLNGKLDASALSRFNSWTFSWRLASDFPIMGGGFETFTPELFQRYATTATDVHGPHSVYFGVLAEHGFPGLILYLLLVLSCLASLQRVIRSARFRGDQRAIDYADMLRLSIVAFLVSGVFLGRAYFDFYFSIVACVAILSHVCREAWAENDAVEFDESAEDGDSMDVPALGMQGILR